MDPYVERPNIWADFHDAFITYLRGELQPQLNPKYAALGRERLYVVQTQRPIYPDVAVIARPPRHDQENGGVAVVDDVTLSEPVIFELVEEEIREPYLDIIEPRAGNRLITSIEVLSPSNKSAGPGRDQYLQKQKEVQASGGNLVEIDLLRAGKPVFRVSPQDLASRLPAWHYLVGVSRRPSQQAIYPIHLRKPLPKIKIPLSGNDPDVALDLQAAFALTWEKGPYRVVVDYDGPPPGELPPEEIAWCEHILKQAGLRK
jgi:hypothetical protein